MRIMVLDDDRALGRALGRILRGHEIVLEHDADRGLELIDRGEMFDLVLCDLHMPKWSGLEIVERMRASFGDGDAPIFVLMTGDEDLPTTGADVFMRKPFGFEELRALVEVVRERHERRSEATTREHPHPHLLAS